MSLFVRPETRAIAHSDVFGEITPGSVRAKDVLRLAPVYSAVALIADLFSSVPLRVVVEQENGEAKPAPLPQWLRDPDPYISPVDWRFQMVVSLKLRGNAYGIVDPSRRYVRWLNPDWVVVDDQQLDMVPRYYVNGQRVESIRQGGSLVHLREFVEPGRVLGLSPIGQFMATFDFAHHANEFGRRWFKQAAVPPALLKSSNARVSPEVLNEVREDFVKATRSGKPVALPGEWSYEKISLTADEAQFLTTIKASASTIASIFRVPPEDIGGEAGSSRTYANRESDASLFNVRTLQPIGGRMSAGFADILPTNHAIVCDLGYLAQPGQLESARVDSEELKNGTLTLAEARRRRGREELKADQIDEWLKWHGTSKSQSESNATSLALSGETT